MAPQKLVVLSEADRDLIQRFLDESRRASVNTTQRGREGQTEHEEWLVPEVYVARVPANGIPALVGSGGDAQLLGREGDQPGFADCQIYRVLATAGKPKLRKVSFHPKTVFNLSTSAINSIPWLLTLRDKFGSWFAAGVGDFTPGTGTDAEELCGHLILDCPADAPGTGSPVSGGRVSVCNDGHTVPDNMFLSMTYDGHNLTVPFGYFAPGLSAGGGSTCFGTEGWEYAGVRTTIVPGLDIAGAGATMCCSGGEFSFTFALYVDNILNAFGASLTRVSSSPVHYTGTTGDFQVPSYSGSTFPLLIELTT